MKTARIELYLVANPLVKDEAISGPGLHPKPDAYVLQELQTLGLTHAGFLLHGWFQEQLPALAATASWSIGRSNSAAALRELCTRP